MNRSSLRVGMIGAGHIARSHVRVWQAEAEVVAVCSRQPHKARRLAAEHGIPHVCETACDLIARDDVDIVSIATPHHLHHPLSMAAIRAGKHVFCEKPLALTLRQAQEMWDAARRAGVKTGVQFSMRFHWPPLIHLRHLIRSGALGAIQYVEAAWAFDWARSPSYPMGWRFKRDMAGTGALGDLGVYLIDAARWLIGEFTEVCGRLETVIQRRPVISEQYDFAEVRRMHREDALPDATETAEVENDDACVILAAFDNGAHGVLRASRLQRVNTIRVEGSERVGLWDLQTAKLRVRPHDEKDFSDAAIPDHIRPASMVTAFLSNIRQNTNDPPTFFDGLKAQAVMDAVVRSHEARQWMAVPDV